MSGRAKKGKGEESAKGQQEHAHIVSATNLESDMFRWLGLKQLKYVDDKGVMRDWECAYRTTRKSGVDAVFIVSHVIEKGHEPRFLFVSQFRPPCEQVVLEWPAGLVDEGETAIEASLRELREETGYFGEVKSESPITFIDPGMSNANLQFVNVVIDKDKELNKNPTTKQDEEESIMTHLIKKSELLEKLRNPNTIPGLEDRDVAVSGLLYSFALGISMFGGAGGGLGPF